MNCNKSHSINLSKFFFLLFLFIILIGLSGFPTFAGTMYVPGEYETIQAALDSSTEGDTIVVAPGTYVENLKFPSYGINLRSENPIDFETVKSTIIDGNQESAVIFIPGGVTNPGSIEGLTLRNGKSGLGGGIASGYNKYNVRHCIIRDNVVEPNSYYTGWPPKIYYDFGYGGGIYGIFGTIENNIIYNNKARTGTAIYDCGHARIRNNTIIGNKLDWYSSLNPTQIGGIGHSSNSSIQNNIIWGNYGEQVDSDANPQYCIIEEWTGGGTGNIDLDPLLIDPAHLDFHLQSNSPAIDTGCLIEALTIDMEGNARGLDRRFEAVGDGSDYDIGAFEYTGETAPTATATPTPTITPTPTVTYTPHDNPLTLHVPDEIEPIQHAIDVAIDGDTIVLATGTYYERIQFKGKNVMLRSIDPLDSAIVEATILSGSSEGTVITFSGSETEECHVRGITIKSGKGNRGGGVNGNGTHATLSLNHIRNNTATNSGAGVYDCDGLILKNQIMNNHAYLAGGGLSNCNGLILGNSICSNRANMGGAINSSEGTFAGNRIIDNTAYIKTAETYEAYRGGGGGGFFGCSGLFINNIIANNFAAGGSIFYYGTWYFIGGGVGGSLCECDGEFYNNTFYGNDSSLHGGIAVDGVMSNCIFKDREDVARWIPITYSCGIESGTGNLDLNPKLVDPENGDFRLRADSPCIDAGQKVDAVEYDIDGNRRGYDGISEERGDGSDYDMGAYEYTGEDFSAFHYLFELSRVWQKQKSLNPCDADSDGRVDEKDVIQLFKKKH